MPEPQKRNLYGRHAGRPVRPAQAAALARVLAAQAFDAHEDLSGTEVWLEVGIGAGEHLAWQAAQNPRVTCIGAEYFLNGVARAAKYIEDARLTNARLHHGDARDILDALPQDSLTRAFILHPDPWPKARQWRRRIISAETLDRLAVVMVPGGVLRMACDHGDYQPWIMRVLQDHPAFTWTAKTVADWTVRPDDWPQTRYEAKSIREGRPTMYIEALRT